MGAKRRMFDDLMTEGGRELSAKYLDKCLMEITGGITCFGKEDIWVEWFRYLLPDLILRAHEQWVSYLLESTISAFMAIFPHGLETEYREFQQDIVDTLSRSLMKPEFWTPHPDFPLDPLKMSPRFLLEEHRGKIFVDFYGFTKAQPELSAALFFCVKYLSTADIPSWVDSILRIEDSQWRAGLLVWILGFNQAGKSRTRRRRPTATQRTLLRNEPLIPSAIESALPEINWEYSHYLELVGKGQGDEFFSSANIDCFLKELRVRLTPATLDQWELQLIDDPRLSELPGFDQLMQQIRKLMA